MKTSKVAIAVLTGALAVAGSAFAADSGLDAYHRVFQGEGGASSYEGSGQVPGGTSPSATEDAHAAYARIFRGEGNASIGEDDGKAAPGIWSTTTAHAHAGYDRVFPGEGAIESSTRASSSRAGEAVAAGTLGAEHRTN